MTYRPLGRSGLKVSSLCVGTMMFGDRTDAQQAGEIVAIARDRGVNLAGNLNRGFPGNQNRDLPGNLNRGLGRVTPQNLDNFLSLRGRDWNRGDRRESPHVSLRRSSASSPAPAGSPQTRRAATT